ncbi:MAG: hypothetical protein ACXABV_09090 [Candidatus Thorarchaeota archaeon]|jgi:hypothetical protein
MVKRHLFGKALLFMVLFLFVSSTAVVNAQDDNETETMTEETETTTEEDHTEDDLDDDNDGVSDDDEDRNRRQVEVFATPTQVEIESKLESGGTEDSFKIEVSTSLDGVEFKVEFETENSTTETEREFEVEFEEIIEYIDDNANGLYDKETDTEVQTLELSSFNPIAYSVETHPDGEIHVLEVTTTDGVFGALVYATGEFADINGSIIAPTQVKIDVIIQGFDYLENDSQLALEVKLEASMETSYEATTEDEEDGRATDEAEVDVIMDEITGFFSWKETAEIDGITYPVNASIVEVSPIQEKIYLNYVRGDVIIHDPKVGFESLLLGAGGFLGIDSILANGFVPIAAIAAIAVVGMIVVVKRRT